MSASQPKTCVICGEDCSDRPRIKDGNGAYACRACVEARQKNAASVPSKPRPKPSAPIPMERGPASRGNDALWGDLAAPGASGGLTACDGCGEPLAKGQVICSRCGHNATTGRNVKTKVERPEREPRTPSNDGSMLPKAILIGGSIALAAGTGLAFVDPLIGPAIIALISLPTWITVTIWGAIAAFQDGETFKGVSLLLICVPFLPLVGIHWCITASGRPVLRALAIVYLVAILCGFIVNVAAMATGQEI